MSDESAGSPTPGTARTDRLDHLQNLLVGNALMHDAPPGTLLGLREMFHSILQGHAVDPDHLAERIGMSDTQTQRVISTVVDRGRAERDDAGRIVAVAGLSLLPTEHAINLAGVPLFTWCALDAIGIPASLGCDALVVSSCADCGASLAVDINAGVPTNHVVASVPPIACANPRQEFCGQSRFFCSEQHARGWLTDAPAVLVLDLRELADAGQTVWSWVR